MVKRNTDYKQVYLVDSFYLKHFNQQNQSFQNATSNTQQISLTTPKTNQYFSNHYSIPPSTLNKYSYNNFQNLVQPFDNQSKNSNTSNVQNSEYNFTNKPDKKFSQDHDDDYEPDPPEPFLYSDNDFQNIAKQPKDTNSNDNISALESFPYYENFQNMNQQLIDSDRRNGDSVFNLNKKDILNKTKKQFYSCYICKRNFSSILLLEKHTKMKHNKYHTSPLNVSTATEKSTIFKCLAATSGIPHHQTTYEKVNSPFKVRPIVVMRFSTTHNMWHKAISYLNYR